MKVGDFVIRKKTSSVLTRGKIYQVRDVRTRLFKDDLVYLVGFPNSFMSDFFELVKKVHASPNKKMVLDADPAVRKGMPITTGVLDYFPLAIAEVAKCSKAGNDQHNPGQPLHWAKEKSTDHVDCIARHLIDRGTFDTDGVRHSAKLAWRALANLQLELEKANAIQS